MLQVKKKFAVDVSLCTVTSRIDVFKVCQNET